MKIQNIINEKLSYLLEYEIDYLILKDGSIESIFNYQKDYIRDIVKKFETKKPIKLEIDFDENILVFYFSEFEYLKIELNSDLEQSLYIYAWFPNDEYFGYSPKENQYKDFINLFLKKRKRKTKEELEWDSL